MNGVECLAGALDFQDILMGPEIQKKKAYYYVRDENNRPTDEINKTSLPGSPEIHAHTAEVLRWTGGDAWFGSVMS
jgi:hypothetical protein